MPETIPKAVTPIKPGADVAEPISNDVPGQQELPVGPKGAVKRPLPGRKSRQFKPAPDMVPGVSHYPSAINEAILLGATLGFEKGHKAGYRRAALLVLRELAQHASYSTGRGARPGGERLAKLTAQSLSTVKRAMTNLERRGLIVATGAFRYTKGKRRGLQGNITWAIDLAAIRATCPPGTFEGGRAVDAWLPSAIQWVEQVLDEGRFECPDDAIDHAERENRKGMPGAAYRRLREHFSEE